MKVLLIIEVVLVFLKLFVSKIRKDKSDDTLAYEDSAYTVILRTFIYFFQIVTHIGQEWSIILKLVVSKNRQDQGRKCSAWKDLNKTLVLSNSYIFLIFRKNFV